MSVCMGDNTGLERGAPPSWIGPANWESVVDDDAFLRAPRGRIALRRDLLSRATSPHGQPVGAAAAAQASGQPTRQKKYQKKKREGTPLRLLLQEEKKEV